MAKSSFLTALSGKVYARFWNPNKVSSRTAETGKLGAPEFCALSTASAYILRCAHRCLPHQRMAWKDIKSLQFIAKKTDRSALEKARQTFEALSSQLGISVDAKLRYDKAVVDSDGNPVIGDDGEPLRQPLKDYHTGEALACFYLSDSLLTSDDLDMFDTAFAELDMVESEA